MTERILLGRPSPAKTELDIALSVGPLVGPMGKPKAGESDSVPLEMLGGRSDVLVQRLDVWRLRKYTRLYRLLFLFTIPAADLVRRPDLVRLVWEVVPYTMLPYVRLRALAEIAADLERAKTDGDFVQCGVWNGGSAAILGSGIGRNRARRRLWLFDSWEGQAMPTNLDHSRSGERGQAGMFRGSLPVAEQLLFHRLRLASDIVQLVPGWFSETVPAWKDRIGPIALLHIDCDFHEAVKLCLDELVPRVSVGGCVVVDDYGEWAGCRRALDEYLARAGMRVTLYPIDYSAVYFRVPDAGMTT